MQRIEPLTNMPGFDVPYVQEKLMEERNWELVRQAMASLPPLQKKIFKLRELKGLSWIAIGEKLGITKYMVKKHHKTASKKLRDYLEGKVNV